MAIEITEATGGSDGPVVPLLQSAPLGTPLMELLACDGIEPGSDPSYQTCKTIYTYHPLGQKIAESPIRLAQSQKRKITVDEAPDEVPKAFEFEWGLMRCDAHAGNAGRLARIYGASAMVIGCKEQDSSKPLDLLKVWQQNVFINEFDPLNTAGSVTVNQRPNEPDFNQAPYSCTVQGKVYHPSRVKVMFNEEPIYLSWTSSAFGFSGRSVYQRALFPLKNFLYSMIADGMILRKLGLLVAKQKPPSSIIEKLAKRIGVLKRSFLKAGVTGQVLTIDVEEEVETLNMQNVDGAGTYARGNTLKDCATACDMPAVMLENETLTAGFGEGTEDAKIKAAFIDTVREWLKPLYDALTSLAQYRAWNPEFFKRVQAKYPDKYQGYTFESAFLEWRENFHAEWPSLLAEPESELIKVDDVKLQALVAVVQTLMPLVDPHNKAVLVQWLCDNLGENKRLFPHELDLDLEALETFVAEQLDQAREQHQASLQGQDDGVAKRFGRFDAVARLDAAVARLPERMRPKSRPVAVA